MAKTKIVSTNKLGKGAKKKKSGFKQMTRKVRRTHKGYGMKNIIKGQMTFKKGKKR